MKCTLFITYLLISLCHGVFEEEEEKPVIIQQSEKITHLHFYFQDMVSGKTPTSKMVIGGSSLYGFGTTSITHDVLTEKPDVRSKVIGRAQGMYAVSSPNDLVLLMVIIFEFTQGKYNGSSISMLGRNHVLDNVREMPIVGGSGLFRFARGYAFAHTFHFDIPTGDATVEYNITVMHF